jgi:hypothetical protein
MALYTRTLEGTLVSILLYSMIRGVQRVNQDQFYMGALGLLKSIVPGMCGDNGGGKYATHSAV